MAHDRDIHAGAQGGRDGRDSDPVGRFEDHLLDREAPEAERLAAAAAAEGDVAARERLAGRHFVHGLLVSEGEAARSKRQARFARAMEGTREESRVGKAGEIAPVIPLLQMRWVVAAAVVLALGVGAWTYFKQPGGDGGALRPGPEVLAPAFEVVAGEVNREKAGDASWLLTSAAGKQATVKFPDKLVVLAPSSTVLMDAKASQFHLISGSASLEGESVGARQGDWSGILSGGVMVMSDASGGSIDVYSGSFRGVGGDVLLSAGQTMMRSAGGKPMPLSAGFLPEWVALGRAEEVYRELNALAEGSLAEQKQAWIETLRPLLAEPVTRGVVVAGTRELLSAGLSDEDTRDLVYIIGELLVEIRRQAEERGVDYEKSIEELCAMIAEFERTITPQLREFNANRRRMLLDEWKKASAEEKAEQREMILKMFRNRPKRAAPSGKEE